MFFCSSQRFQDHQTWHEIKYKFSLSCTRVLGREMIFIFRCSHLLPVFQLQQQQQQQHLFKHDKKIQQKLMWSCTDNKTKFLTKSNKTKFLTNYKKTNVRFLHIFNNKNNSSGGNDSSVNKNTSESLLCVLHPHWTTFISPRLVQI